MADMREVEKSEISHTNAIMKYNPTKKIFTAAKNETGVWSHTLAELASRNWSLYPVHSYRATLMAWWEGWKTGIGALEDVGNIAWHRCTILAMTEGSRVSETCSMNVTAWESAKLKIFINQHCSIVIMVFSSCMDHSQCQCKPFPPQEYVVCKD